MSEKTQKEKALKVLSTKNIFIAIFIGLVGTAYLFYRSVKGQPISSSFQELSEPNWMWLVTAVLVLLARDAGYIYRIKNLTENQIGWKGSIYIIILWEFASAVTPSVVGGTALAIFLLNKEGLNMGKSIAYVMLTAILDNLFFIFAAPLVLFQLSDNFLSAERELFGIYVTLDYVFFISYALIAVYTTFMAFGVLINPKLFQSIIVKTTDFIGLNKRLKKKAYKLSVDVIVASRELKGKSFSYWLKASSSTIFVWSARYFIVNCLIAGFKHITINDHINIFSKHVVLWISQLVSPTPGGAGLAEYFFVELMGVGIAVALIWRILTYYAYLVAGTIALPQWLKRVFK